MSQPPKYLRGEIQNSVLWNQAASTTWGMDRRVRSQAGAFFCRVQLQSACPHPSWSSSGLRHLQLHLQMSWVTSDQMKPSPANNQVMQLILSLLVEMAIFDHITRSFSGLPLGWELAQVLLAWGGLGLKQEPKLLSIPLSVPSCRSFQVTAEFIWGE